MIESQPKKIVVVGVVVVVVVVVIISVVAVIAIIVAVVIVGYRNLSLKFVQNRVNNKYLQAYLQLQPQL